MKLFPFAAIGSAALVGLVGLSTIGYTAHAVVEVKECQTAYDEFKVDYTEYDTTANTMLGHINGYKQNPWSVIANFAQIVTTRNEYIRTRDNVLESQNTAYKVCNSKNVFADAWIYASGVETNFNEETVNLNNKLSEVHNSLKGITW